MNIELKILDARIQSVEYGTPHAAAVDLCAARIEGVPLTDALIIGPGAVAKIGTGIAAHIGSIREDDGTEPVEFPDVSLAGLVLPRSGLGTKHRIRLANTAGLIDADYQGEIILAIENGDKEEPFIIEPMMRLAQMMIVPVARPAYRVVAEFSETSARGAGGFGSTGNLSMKTEDALINETARLRAALAELEGANDALCALRTRDQYLSMIDGGQKDALYRLDEARRAARSLVTPDV